MHRSSLKEHGLRIAAAALASMALAPAALADDGMPAQSDPAAAALAMVDDALAGTPMLDPATIVAAVLPTVPPVVQAPSTDPAPAAAPETVPAAAAEPNQAMEPHPSPPPPPEQPHVLSPLEAAADLAPISVADALPAAADVAAEPEAAPQYQPVATQYQPAAAPVVAQSDPSPAAPAPAPVEQEWNWDWTWSCGGSKPPTQPPAIPGNGLPTNWNWNWAWNCDPEKSTAKNKEQESGTQYQGVNTRYQPLNINVTIRIASPGDNGPVTQTNVVFAVDAGGVSAGVQAAVPAATAVPAASSVPESAPGTPGAATAEEKPGKRDAAAKRKFASADDERRAAPAAQPVVAEAPYWTARPVVPKRLQPANPEAHRSRTKHRRPTRHPHTPKRAPVIPVASGGASPSGGSDGGGSGFALLLVPFLFALVDSARRSVRDITPPMGRAHRLRQERPG